MYNVENDMKKIFDSQQKIDNRMPMKKNVQGQNHK